MLNAEQQRAAKAPAGPQLILAGAGTGKTRTIVHRIAHLIGECGVLPYRILAVTFTNKSASELKERLDAMIGEHAGTIVSGTFHSISLRFLRRYADSVGYPRSFQIIDGNDQRTLIKRLLKAQNIDPKVLHHAQLLHWIEQHKHAGKMPEDIAVDSPSPISLQPLYALYQQQLKQLERMDFSDLIVHCVRLLRADGVIAKAMRCSFDHVLVDEYQDTNPVQHAWLSLLCKDHRNLTVVGDDDQSIYGWRGADVRHILDFQKQWPDAGVYCLEENYRSGEAILRLANAVITEASDRHQKQLRPTRGSGKIPAWQACHDEHDEARRIAEVLQQRHQKGVPWSDMAVLYRSNHQSLPLERIFRELSLPYRIHGALSFFERVEVKDALCFWALVNACADGMHLMRIANKPKCGIGEKTWGNIQSLWLDSGLRVSDWLDLLAHQNNVSVPAKKLHFLATVVADVRNGISQREAGDGGLFAVLEQTGYFQYLEAQGELEAVSRKENLQSLRAHIEMQLLQGFTPIEILDLAALLQSSDGIADAQKTADDTETKQVQLMSLHRAKGLEFNTVAICGVEEGLLPHQRALNEGCESLAEERRLLYVGITRARDCLLLTSASSRRVFGDYQYPQPSRFMCNLSNDLLHTVWQSSSAAVVTNEFFGEICIACKVVHPSFGAGVVMTMEGQGSARRVSIQFDGYGLRHLMLKYAQLTVLDSEKT
ncbi:MAG: UvrD-helicase domain-containing protein [Mariprofundaceae bacterium]|nr:UvrD-helicase domain-containing protein [Mariprofundaceae bacterium]